MRTLSPVMMIPPVFWPTTTLRFFATLLPLPTMLGFGAEPCSLGRD
jgi:hypothetical protein